jgi:hypothetical protein
VRPSTAKAKGRATEQALCDHLHDEWSCLYVERRRLAGALDRGDIAGLPGVTIEVKSGGRVDIAGWLAELEAEMGNDDTDFGFVAVRPKGHPDPRDWWAVMPLQIALRLLDEADLLPRRERL